MITDKLPCVLYGGAYSPEQWPENVWQEDVALMCKSGVNLVTLGLFSWAKLQPGPDTYTLDWLERVLNLLQENGLAAILGTATASPPAWLGRLYPESLPQNSHGTRQHFCPNSTAYRNWSVRLVRQLATRFGTHPAVVLWHVNHAYGSRSGICACESCAQAFRSWLEAKYVTLEALNEQWGTAFWGQWYHRWDEIHPPRQTPAALNPSQRLDYQRFMNESWLACFLSEKAVLKELAPNVPVTTTFAGAYGMNKAANGFQWAQHLDCVSFSSFPDPAHADAGDIAFSLDLQRGFGKGRPWLLIDQAPNQVNNQKFNAVKRPGQMRLWSYQALAHGADGVLFHQWRAPRAGAEKFESAMLPHGGPNTRVHREINQLGRELPKLAALCGATVKAEIALLVDWDNYCAVEMNVCPGPLDYSEVVRGYYRALFAPGTPIDIVQPDSDLSHYKVVVAPVLYLVRPGVAENLVAYVHNGGTLVMSFFSGIVDANDGVFPGGFPAPFRKLLGLHVEEIETLDPQQLRHIRTPERAGRCSQWIELLALEGAEPVATFTEDFYAGRPALTRNAFGRGLAYYVATVVEHDFLHRFFLKICEDTGVQPALKVPAGVEAMTRENEQGRFLFLLNHTANPQHIELPGLEGMDLLTNELIDRPFQLAPRDVRIIQL